MLANFSAASESSTKIMNAIHKLHSAKRSETRLPKKIVYGPGLKYDIRKTITQVSTTNVILHSYPE
jgi:hypothetical protein